MKDNQEIPRRLIFMIVVKEKEYNNEVIFLIRNNERQKNMWNLMTN
jgi:hypothetical protein